MLEGEMARTFAREATPSHIKALREHIAQEKAAAEAGESARRNELLGDFHVRMAELLGNEVLAQILRELASRSSLISLMYQREGAAEHSSEEHLHIVRALAARDEDRAARLITEHLDHVEASLDFDRPLLTQDIAQALSS